MDRFRLSQAVLAVILISEIPGGIRTQDGTEIQDYVRMEGSGLQRAPAILGPATAVPVGPNAHEYVTAGHRDDIPETEIYE